MIGALELFDAVDDIVARHCRTPPWRARRAVLATTHPMIEVDGRVWRAVGRRGDHYLYTLRQVRQVRQELIQRLGPVYEERLTRLVADSTDLL